jgi:integrase
MGRGSGRGGMHRLSALAVAKASEPGMYGDGGGLWLQITASKNGGRPNKSWLFRYAVGSRTREMGLGSLATVSLAEARDAALASRKLRLAGHDPIEVRNAERTAKAASTIKVITFDQCAEGYIEAHRAGWRSSKHAAQWPATLGQYVSPVFGKLPVDQVDTALVLRVLEPIWREMPETANRLRGRIERVMDWAAARGYRARENPARWRGHLAQLLPSHRKIRPVVHHPAMPFVEVPAFLVDLRARSGVAPRALEFLILTAGRSGEVLGAQWAEIDFASAIWTVPPNRMKGNREHRVPLTARCLAILEEMQAVQQGPYVFPGRNGDAPMWGMSFTYLLRQLGCDDVTAHGFRSSFRDWAGERTAFPREVAEAALAHQTGNAVELAYRRADALEKRRKLMTAWAEFCAKPLTTGAVVNLRQA